MDCSMPTTLSFTLSWSLPKFVSIALVMPSSHLILWCPLLLLSSIFSSIREFSNNSTVHIWWAKYWSFSFTISPSSEYSGLISLKIDWFDPLAAQGTLRSLLLHHSSKALILWCSPFFMFQLSQLYANWESSVEKLWKVLKEMGISYHLTYLLRNLTDLWAYKYRAVTCFPN